MARKKVKLQYIQNDSARRATFRKRRKGLVKKVSELSTLCGVSACVVMYGPNESEPEVWPSPSEARRVVARFKSMPEMEKCKKMLNQEEFLQQRIEKLREKLKKQVMDNQEKENTRLLFHCMAGQRNLNDLTLENLGDLLWLADGKMKAIMDRIQLLSKPTPPALPPPPHPQPNYVMNNPNPNPPPSDVHPHHQYIVNSPPHLSSDLHLHPHPHPHPHSQYMMNIPLPPPPIPHPHYMLNTLAAVALNREYQLNGTGGEDQVAGMEAVHAAHQPWFKDTNAMNRNDNLGFPGANEVDNNAAWSQNHFFS